MVLERHHLTLFVSSLITVAAFVGATVVTQYHLRRVDALSSTLESDAIPSIELLSDTALRLTRLDQAISQMEMTGPSRTAALASAREEVEAVHRELTRYLGLPLLPGENSLWSRLQRDVGDAVTRVRAALAMQNGDRSPAAAQPAVHVAPEYATVHDALNRAIQTVVTAIDFDVRKSEAMAADVRTIRTTMLPLVVSLDVAATVVAMIGVFIARRASRHHERLLQTHTATLAERVVELDRFAGRVAHDILSPLGTVSTGLSLLARTADDRERTWIDRSQHAVQRVQQLVDGLLVFARSGARPDPGAVCGLERVLASSVADCAEPAAEQGIELRVDVHGETRVRCSDGVVTSIVQNLVRNAIKYMGDAPVRRVTVRTRPAGPAIRIEVEDTGPGIAKELQAAIFEPFVRGSQEGVPGTGLGLSTVRRLAESHGGRAGVRSAPGQGSVFWVDLPIVHDGPDADAAPVSLIESNDAPARQNYARPG